MFISLKQFNYFINKIGIIIYKKNMDLSQKCGNIR